MMLLIWVLLEPLWSGSLCMQSPGSQVPVTGVESFCPRAMQHNLPPLSMSVGRNAFQMLWGSEMRALDAPYAVNLSTTPVNFTNYWRALVPEDKLESPNYTHVYSQARLPKMPHLDTLSACSIWFAFLDPSVRRHLATCSSSSSCTSASSSPSSLWARLPSKHPLQPTPSPSRTRSQAPVSDSTPSSLPCSVAAHSAGRASASPHPRMSCAARCGAK